MGVCSPCRSKNLADFHNHCDDVHRYIPSSKESFEVESRKDNRRQLGDFLKSYGEADSENGSALIGEWVLQAPLRIDLYGLPFKCPFDKCPHPCSPSAGFPGKEYLRHHLNAVHDLGFTWTESVLDSAISCTITSCVRSLPGQGFASHEDLQSHDDGAHFCQRSDSRPPGTWEYVEEAAADQRYACMICHPQSVYHEQMFTAKGLRNHLVSAHRMATDTQRDWPPQNFYFDNRTQTVLKLQGEPGKGKAKVHAQTSTSSQAPSAIPLKPTVKLPPVWKS